MILKLALLVQFTAGLLWYFCSLSVGYYDSWSAGYCAGRVLWCDGQDAGVLVIARH